MAADTTWTQRFAVATADSCPWRSSDAFSTLISGEVYRRADDRWYQVSWIVTPQGNLFCPFNRGNNVAMITAPTPARAVKTPTRSLDTPFIISSVQDAQVSYTVDLVYTLAILGTGTESAQVDLQIDGMSIAQAKNALTATLSLGLSLTPPQRKVLAAFVPAGSTVQLVSTVSSNGTATLISSQETLL